MKLNKAMAGAHVWYCGHKGWFVADVYIVGNAAVIRSSEPISGNTLHRENLEAEATHRVSDFPKAGFWRPDLGVLVVPAAQVELLAPGIAKQKRQAALPRIPRQ